MYTIKSLAPGRWVASNGRDHVEADSPDDALYGLMLGEIDREDGAGDFDAGASAARKSRAADRVGEQCLVLVRLLAIGAPGPAVKAALKAIGKAVQDWTDA